ncbi:MAG: carbohydrate ABC transporter permease [Halodesulfurarchaeum sp.]
MAEDTWIRRVDPRRIALYLVLVGMIGFYLMPLESGLVTAFKTQDAFFRTTPFLPPGVESFTVDPWITAFDRLEEGLLNSLLFTVPATLMSATLGSLAAYGLTKVEWRGQGPILVLFVAGIFIPYQAVLVPLTRFWSMVPIQELFSFFHPISSRASLVALAVTHTAYGIPICTLLFRAHYQSIDTAIIEAARLDGARVAKIYWRIILPLSLPMFAVTIIYQFTNIWNDLLFALVLVSDPAETPVTIALNQLKGSMVQQYNLQMAGAFITALPTLLVYIFFGEQFAEGVRGGGT